MKRRALILFCTDTESGHLDDPKYDNVNYRNFLTSHLGGDWFDNAILSIKSPTSIKVFNVMTQFFKRCRLYVWPNGKKTYI